MIDIDIDLLILSGRRYSGLGIWEHLSLSFPRGIFFSSSIQSQDAPTNTFC